MPTPRAEIRALLPSRLVRMTLVWISWPSGTQVIDYGNEVAVWIEAGYAAHPVKIMLTVAKSRAESLPRAGFATHVSEIPVGRP